MPPSSSPSFAFSAEYAKSGRSTCKGCKKIIALKSLRIGVEPANADEVENKAFASVKWYHPTCKCVSQFRKTSSWWEQYTPKPSSIEGFDNLEEKEQEIVKTLLSGLRKGTGAPVKKGAAKKEKNSNDDDEDEEEEEEEVKKPAKPVKKPAAVQTKKKGKQQQSSSNDEGGDESDEGGSQGSDRSSKGESGDEGNLEETGGKGQSNHDEDEEEKPASKVAAARGKKRAVPTAEPKSKKTKKSLATKDEGDDESGGDGSGEEEEDSSPKPKKAKASPKGKGSSSGVFNAPALSSEENENINEKMAMLSKKTVAQLKAMLKKNDQKVSGTKQELITRVGEFMVVGCYAKCDECGAGLRWDSDSGEFSCAGKYENAEHEAAGRLLYRWMSKDGALYILDAKIDDGDSRASSVSRSINPQSEQQAEEASTEEAKELEENRATRNGVTRVRIHEVRFPRIAVEWTIPDGMNLEAMVEEMQHRVCNVAIPNFELQKRSSSEMATESKLRNIQQSTIPATRLLRPNPPVPSAAPAPPPSPTGPPYLLTRDPLSRPRDDVGPPVDFPPIRDPDMNGPSQPQIPGRGIRFDPYGPFSMFRADPDPDHEIPPGFRGLPPFM